MSGKLCVVSFCFWAAVVPLHENGAAAEPDALSPAEEKLQRVLAEREAGKPAMAVLTMHQPELLQVPAAFADFTEWPLPRTDMSPRVPVDPSGCKEYEPEAPGFVVPLAPGYTIPFVSIVRRGSCTFVQKARSAQDAGAKGVIIINEKDEIQLMGAGNDTGAEDIKIFVVSVSKTNGEKIRNASIELLRDGTPVAALTIKPYEESLWNVSQGLLVLMATSLVALGAFFSTADLKLHGQDSFSHALAPREEEVLEVDQTLASSFFVVGSCMLVFLFFFMRYMIYVIILGFCVGGASCITQFGAICLNHAIPGLRRHKTKVPVLGPVAVADVLAGIPAVAIVVAWVPLRNSEYGWIFQDIIGAGFLCWLQRTLRLPNIKIATIFLTAMFFFDIFWVFISPLFFHESVMVRVATGGGTGETVPMLLRLPAFGDPFGSDRLLGFGDIALPGLLVAYLRRHDLVSRRRLCSGYFLPALVGYFFGLIATMIALMVMRQGQPVSGSAF